MRERDTKVIRAPEMRSMRDVAGMRLWDVGLQKKDECIRTSSELRGEWRITSISELMIRKCGRRKICEINIKTQR
jgi:hypothetical protein